MTRPTVYAYFATRDAIMFEALARAGRELARRITERTASLRGPADRVVEAMLIAIRELPVEPGLMLLVEPTSRFRHKRWISPGALEVATSVLDPILARRASPGAERDERVEMVIRMLFSLLTIESPAPRSAAELRGFLHRRLVPALGL